MQKQRMYKINQKRVAVVNDLACYGRCALTVSLPILSAMKLECCPLPTAILSSNAAFPGYAIKDETEQMKSIINHWRELDLSFDGICSGFLNSVEQVQLVEQFFRDFKKENTKIFLDPIMGDYGKLYSVTSKDVCKEMKHLLPYVDVVTPNLTECCFLLDMEYKDECPSEEELCNIAKRITAMGPTTIVITGLPMEGQIQNFIYEEGYGHSFVNTDKIGTERCGTGDVFMSVFAGCVMNDYSIKEAVQKAVDFLNKAIQYTVDCGVSPRNGVSFEPFLEELTER